RRLLRRDDARRDVRRARRSGGPLRESAAIRSEWGPADAGSSPVMPRYRAVTLPDDDSGDAALVARVRDGDRTAEEALYPRHGPPRPGGGGRLLGASVEAEAVVQDVFVTAFAKLDRLRNGAAFGAWVLRAAVRRVWGISRWRAVRRRFGLDHGAVAYLAPN